MSLQDEREAMNGFTSYNSEDKLLWKEVRVRLEDINNHQSKYMKKEIIVNNNYHDEQISDHKSEIKQIKQKNVYEVEKIMGKKVENNVPLYLIKWKNWDAEYNTWEPLRHLNNCAEALKEFEEERLKMLERFQKHINYYPDLESVENCMQLLRKKGKRVNGCLDDMDNLFDKIETFFTSAPSKCKRMIESIKNDILVWSVYKERSEQQESLRDWENEMNRITKGRPYIRVENEVDLEREPQEFFYIDEYLPGSGVVIPDEPPIGCECASCDSKTNCCYALSEGSFPYTSACRIRVPPGTPIYECNKRCTCSTECPNRVVQRGSQMKLCVFRTDNGRGWGVKTLRVIKKGTFVIQYVGEVITNEEAELRGKQYDAAGRTYLFDLDYNETEGQCPYTVDAATYGNISHFINHSCDPNLAVYAVWINCLDPNLPKLALFATRDIKQNEEITFNYMCQATKEEPRHNRLDLPDEQISENDDSISSKRTRCKCGAACCRQYLF